MLSHRPGDDPLQDSYTNHRELAYNIKLQQLWLVCRFRQVTNELIPYNTVCPTPPCYDTFKPVLAIALTSNSIEGEDIEIFNKGGIWILAPGF